jgi:superfamily II DNA/RNA helicase
MSYNYAARLEEQLVGQAWDLVVIDEAHKLRNAHRDSNKIGQALRRALFGRKKLLLTATPLQNSLMELYGMTTLIDEHIFGDDKAFRKQFMQGDSDQLELKKRLSHFVKRTLRKQVLEYVKYTQRKAITIPFTPSEKELALYDAVSSILEKEDSYALPKRQRHLTGLILRKLLASSSFAVLNTLEVMQRRLIDLKNSKKKLTDDLILEIIEDDDIETDYLDEDDLQAIVPEEHVEEAIDHQKLTLEIKELGAYIQQAQNISNDEKANALLKALSLGFEQMRTMGAAQKAIIFTESKRTQAYLAAFLAEHGYKNKLVIFSGSNNHPEATQIYQQWQQTYAGSDRITGSPQVDRRTALIDYFRDSAEIMIATEAAAEGVNLQFCSLLINYDLPWNPQRVEQRIGRCHRYGQKFDVVVINFVNQRNYADQRVLELLSEKFNLFDGVFGASDSVLGSLESGVDFEKRIQQIYQECRSPEEIESAFAALQKELEADINQKMQQTQQVLLEHFDEDIHDLLKIKLDQAKERLDKVGRWFWAVTTHQLQQKAIFSEAEYSFTLTAQVAEQPPGKYQFIRRGDEQAQTTDTHTRLYRISHPLGEYVIDNAKAALTPRRTLTFNYQQHDGKVSVAEKLQGQAGWISLHLLSIEAFNIEQHLVFTGITDAGQVIDSEACKKLFNLGAEATESAELLAIPDKLRDTQTRNIEAQLAIAMDTNNKYFQDERDKLDKWADDKMLAAEQALTDTKNQIKSLKRESRHAVSVDEQQQFQQQLKDLELKQRRLRQNIWDVEDSIAEKRDELIAALEARMKQKTDIKELFTVRWNVI